MQVLDAFLTHVQETLELATSRGEGAGLESKVRAVVCVCVCVCVHGLTSPSTGGVGAVHLQVHGIACCCFLGGLRGVWVACLVGCVESETGFVSLGLFLLKLCLAFFVCFSSPASVFYPFRFCL